MHPALDDPVGSLTKLYQAHRYDFMGNHRFSQKSPSLRRREIDSLTDKRVIVVAEVG